MKTTGLAGLALLLAACGGGDALADRDPKGAEACAELAQAFENKNDTEAAMAGSMRSGAAAAEAETASIRDATIDLLGDKAADPEAMVQACEAEGVDMPSVPS